MKSGQIAHIDRNSGNNLQDNLAFLCLEHHDLYDSRTSQSKGLTPSEIKRYRDDLLGVLGSAFAQPVHFGELLLPRKDPYAGHYIRIGGHDEPAEISFTPLPDTYEGQLRYFVNGEAYRGLSREFGPNMGFLEGLAIFEESEIVTISHNSTVGTFEDAMTQILFLEDGFLRVTEENVFGIYGMGVSFEGIYRKVK